MGLNSPTAQPPDKESIGSLLSGLIGDLQQLIRGEVSLAKTEIREEIGTAMGGMKMLGAAAIFGLVALILLMFGVAAYLEKWVEDWQAMGIVGLVLLVLAGMAALVGKRRLQASTLAPDQTIASLKEDKEWASQQVKSVRS